MATRLTDARCDEIVTAMRDYGLRVVEDAGWRERGTGRTFEPEGVLVHHDALSESLSDASALHMMRFGHASLSGPLCNEWIDSDSTVYLIAAGNANHAGKGSSSVLGRIRQNLPPLGDARIHAPTDDFVGNPYYWGIEARNAGTGTDVWEQLAAYEKSCAALCDVFGWSHNRVVAHREHTARKPDPAGIHMPTFRTDVWKYRETRGGFAAMSPEVIVCVLYRLYLGRDPESLATIAGGVEYIRQHGDGAYLKMLLESDEGRAFEDTTEKLRTGVFGGRGGVSLAEVLADLQRRLG